MIQLIDLAKQYRISLTEKQIELFQIYSDFLLEYNQKVNLTAIKTQEEVMTKHFLDSLLVLDAYSIPQNATLIDIGTGAGFPGIPLKIVREDILLTLLDSTQKRLTFLDQLEEKLGIASKHIHARAEDCGREFPFRDGYQIVTSRAVANLPALLELCLPYVEVGGVFLALKGPGIDEEQKLAKKALHILGGEVEEIKHYSLPDGEERNIVIIRKTKETPEKYPRQGTKLSKSPL